MSGHVALVGAGPGHPGLLTIRGRDCLERATVVVHDRLIPNELLDFAPASARRIYVGKGPRDHAVPQDGINELLVELAQAGESVVRLKGGDPFVFGRGGEEVLSLVAEGLSFEVVPGVTSAISVPSFAGIPVTHRGIAASFTVMTGHEDPNKPESSHRWDALATGADTLIVLMGVEQITEIAQRLIDAGRPANQPAALVQWGGTPRQVTLQATLETIAERAREAGIRPPAILVAGDVVSLREHLSWFENLPLFGLRVLVTRSRTQASSFVRGLRELGAAPIEIPSIDIQPVEGSRALDLAINELGSFDWIVFTSANGVQAALTRLLDGGGDVRRLANARLCAIGPATEAALRNYGPRADLVPPKFTSVEIVKAFAEHRIENKRILLMRTDIAPVELADELGRLGASVQSVTAYRTAQASPSDLLHDLISKQDVDVLTFTSASTVRNLVKALSEADLESARQLPSICIGPVTASTAQELEMNVQAEASEHTINGLLETLVQWNAARKEQS